MNRVLTIIIIFLFVITGCDKRNATLVFSEEDYMDIAQFLEENQETYSKFYDVMLAGDLDKALGAYNPHGNGFTLFLPTNEAFERYIEKTEDYSSFEELVEDREFVRILARYHLVIMQILTREFPYGALPDTTATGDILSIVYGTDQDSIVYYVNSSALVIVPNLEMINGYIHVISEVLQPVKYTGFEWLRDNGSCNILSEALIQTGIVDTLGQFRRAPSGKIVNNRYTILAEPDSVYKRNGIESFEDLAQQYATPGLDYSDPNNALYQFTAYHILEGSYFLADIIESKNYNSYSNAPVNITTGLEIKINDGVDTFRLVISENFDTTAVTHIGLYYQESDNISKNGPIHLLDEIMDFYVPTVSRQTYQFYESPGIGKLRNTQGSHYIYDDEQEELEVISWIGPDEIIYYKTNSTSEKASNTDYIEIQGNFSIRYTLPKILPGKYEVYFRTNGYSTNNQNATVITYLDGKQLGSTFNLNSGGTSANPFNINFGMGYLIGKVDFFNYQEHTITIESFIPGKMQWDFVRFEPIVE